MPYISGVALGGLRDHSLGNSDVRGNMVASEIGTRGLLPDPKRSIVETPSRMSYQRDLRRLRCADDRGCSAINRNVREDILAVSVA